MKRKKKINKSQENVFGGINDIAGEKGDAMKGIRHLERPVKLDFLGSGRSDNDEQYGSAEDMEDKWGLSDKQATVKLVGRKRIIGLIIAFVVLSASLAGIFYVLPRVLPELFKGSNIELFVQPVVHREFSDSSYRVVTVSNEYIMTDSLPSSDRISEVLYNEPVRFIEQGSNGYVLIETMDKTRGYIKESVLSEGMDSVEPDLHKFKLVVSDPSKNIMTHASNGTLITRVMMNTVIYADVEREGVYQVSLPGGESGWIGSSGVIELAPRGNLQQVSSRYFVSSLMTYVHARYVSNGLTMNGISINGAVYVCSEINGIRMPRDMQSQSLKGEEVKLRYDAVTGEAVIEDIIPGDIVFLRSPVSDVNDKTIYEEAVCTDTGWLLMRSPAGTTIRTREFKAGDEITERIVSIRRVFASD